jgi:peptidoglycan/LPS O-acetylase OafA/YrhL
MYKMFDGHLIGTYGYQFWFISTIIQFYLLFPLIVLMRTSLPGFSFFWGGLIISWIWALVILLLNKEELRNWNSFFLIYLWEFILGMICAELYYKKGYAFWKIPKLFLMLITVGGLVVYSLMAILLGRPGKLFNDLPGLFGYAALCILIYSFQIKIVNRFILFTAKISYSIFLIHFLVLNLLQLAWHLTGLPWPEYMLIFAIILCYAAAIPFQKWLDRLTGRMLRPGKAQAAIHVK